MSGLETLALIAGGLGTAVSTAGTLAAGQAASDQADWQARQLERKAMEERAAGQRSAFQERKQAERVQSRLQAVSAASGGGTTDPTIVGLAEDIAGTGEEQALLQFALGENRARGAEDQAAAARAKGQAAQSGAFMSAIGGVIGGAPSLYQKYSSFEKALIRDRSLGRPRVEFPGLGHGSWLGAPPGFCSEIGGLLPMAPCGRSSL
jgi:hypothetical protein